MSRKNMKQIGAAARPVIEVAESKKKNKKRSDKFLSRGTPLSNGPRNTLFRFSGTDER